MEKICDGCITTAWVNEIKFSPTGKILAVGSHDKKMYFYDVPNMFNNSSNFNENSLDKNEWENCMKETKFIFDKHSSAVLHCDYSLDGKYLQTDSQVRFTDLNICACFPYFSCSDRLIFDHKYVCPKDKCVQMHVHTMKT